MKLVVTLAVIILVVGLCLGWFHFSSSNHNNQANVTMSVDKDKMEKDKDKAVDEVKGLGQQAKEDVQPTTQKAEK